MEFSTTERSEEAVPLFFSTKKKDIPHGLWLKCPDCGGILFKKTLRENLRVCPKCAYHFTLGARERISSLLGKDFKEFSQGIKTANPLNFTAVKDYREKIAEEQKKTELDEACLVGEGHLDNKKVILAVTDSRFMMGSMGSVVGERITQAAERAKSKKIPLIIVSGSGGGARMQEGILSLMQMAKTSAAISKLDTSSIPFISILTNPTMAGVLASFASLGDVIIAEPRALIGFTGPRVIEQTIRQKLPAGFQKSEFLLQHGLIDMIVDRRKLKGVLKQVLECLNI